MEIADFFDRYGKVHITISNDRMRIYDTCNSYECSFLKSFLPEYVKLIKKIYRENGSKDYCTRDLHLDWYEGNWVRGWRIPFILECLEGYGKLKHRSKKQLERCKNSSLLSIVKIIDFKKKLCSTN